MYKVIVVGTDGSGRAGIAVREALGIAKSSGATLHVVHVVHTTTMLAAENVDLGAIADATAEMHQEGNRICAQIEAEAEHQGVATQVHNVEGEPAQVLLGVAEGVNADLIVIGNRGMSGIKRFVLGSVPNKVAHRCPCSVLIVNTDVESVPAGT
ncbi:MAG: universal stress protein [Acidimicrobiales bacterium]